MEKIGTKAVHSGERKRNRENRSVTISTEQTAAYYFKDTQQIIDFYQGKLKGVKYGRYGCPTQHAVEEKMADLDGGNRALAFASGMSAITTSILALLKMATISCLLATVIGIQGDFSLIFCLDTAFNQQKYK